MIMMEAQLKPFLEEFQVKLKSAINKHSLIGVEEFNELQDSFEFILKGLETNEDYVITLEPHLIDKFNLAEYCVNLVNSNLSFDEVGKTLSLISNVAITANDVEEWITTYSNIAFSKKSKTYGNIFNIQERMQDVYAELQDQLEIIKATDKEDFFRGKTTKEQVILDALTNIRMLTKDSREVLKSVDQYQRLEEFKYLVIETIKSVDPYIATQIIQKLQEDKALFNVLLPPKSY